MAAVEDYLEADAAIRGQNFVCLSFISPEKVLKNKEIFRATKFLEYLFSGQSTEGSPSPAQVARENMLKDPSIITYEKVAEMYEDWKYSREEDLESEFQEKNDFHTTMRGVKVRGVYDTHREATVRAQVLQRRDPNFHVFVGQVGYWLPWDPTADKIQEQEYQESQLNTLVKKYNENIEQRNDHFEEVKREKLEKIRKENEERRKQLTAQGVTGAHLDNPENSKKHIEELRRQVERADGSGVEVPAPVIKASGMEASAGAGEGANVTEEGNTVDKSIKASFEAADPWLARKAEESAATENNSSA
jgi:hypothetical protein